MLATVKHLLAQKRIVLASSSPRRQELVKSIVRVTAFIISYHKIS